MNVTHFGNGAAVCQPEPRATGRFLRARFSQIGSKKNADSIWKPSFRYFPRKISTIVRLPRDDGDFGRVIVFFLTQLIRWLIGFIDFPYMVLKYQYTSNSWFLRGNVSLRVIK